MARFDTIADILTDVGAELGLGTLTSVYPSTDATVTQMQALLKALGRSLVLAYPWLQNLIPLTFTTTSATSYTLPADFLRMENGTGWNRSTRQPLQPVSPQEWEALTAGAITVGMPVLFRPRLTNDVSDGCVPRLELLATPTSGQTIALQYRSSYWLASGAQQTAGSDTPSAPTNVVRIDSLLFGRALKLAWLRQKGFESTAAQQDFEDALAATEAVTVWAGPALSLNGPRLLWGKLLDASNIPETGYGG
jgi:hypothetical protein